MLRKLLRALRFVVERILMPTGTNLRGLTVATIIFLPLGILIHKFGRSIEGVVNCIGGGLICGIDWFFRSPREFFAGQSLSDLRWELLFDVERGAKFFFLPIWMWGVLWTISGLVLVLIELIKG